MMSWLALKPGLEKPGKTAAFVLPLIKYIEEIGFSSTADFLPQKPEAMIITPTHDLS